MPEIVKSFETIPSYELMKHNTINMIMNLTDKLSKMNQMFLLNRRDLMTELGFISDILTFYQFIRPKIVDYNSRMHNAEFEDLIHDMDYFIMHPKRLKASDAIQVFNMLNYFCEKYRLTSTVVFTGIAAPKTQAGQASMKRIDTDL